MLNDLTSPVSFLETRHSGRPREMVAPGPTAEELDRILSMAIRVPDHGKIAPWRFVVIGKDQRDEFALLLRRALTAENPCASRVDHEAADQFAHYGEALVVLISRPNPDHKVPVWEQQLSCGAVGMSLLNASHALGFVAGWLTGWQTYSEMVRKSLCEPGEHIAGFFFIGSPSQPLIDRPRAKLAQVKRGWKPEAAFERETG